MSLDGVSGATGLPDGGEWHTYTKQFTSSGGRTYKLVVETKNELDKTQQDELLDEMNSKVGHLADAFQLGKKTSNIDINEQGVITRSYKKKPGKTKDYSEQQISSKISKMQDKAGVWKTVKDTFSTGKTKKKKEEKLEDLRNFYKEYYGKDAPAPKVKIEPVKPEKAEG